MSLLLVKPVFSTAGTIAISLRGTAPDTPVLKLRTTAEAATGVTGRRIFSVVTIAYDTAPVFERLMVPVWSGSIVVVRVWVWAPSDCTNATFTSATFGPGLKILTSADAESSGRKGIRR